MNWVSTKLFPSLKPAPAECPYYGTQYSEPVIVTLETEDGKRMVSPNMWAYDFHEFGWVWASLREGPHPDNYAEFGLVVAWTPAPKPYTEE